MTDVLLIGNPNVGKSTLFNSLTKSNAHTGNFHGVTIDAESKVIFIEKEEYKVTDLPGMYSLNSFSFEEEVSKNKVFELKDKASILVIVDACSLRKNLYLCLQLQELNIPFKILLNNYKEFSKRNKLDIVKLEHLLGVEIEIINAKKIKATKELFEIKKYKRELPYLVDIKQKSSESLLKDDEFVGLINDWKTEVVEKEEKIEKLKEEIVIARYNYIDKILNDSLEYDKNFIYGLSKWDKFITNPFVSLIGFILMFFLSIYFVFFIVGAFFNDKLVFCFENFVSNPMMNTLYLITDNIWIIEFFRQGVFASISTILGFVPQIALLFIMLTMLEDSGLISRMCYSLDDMLTSVGLNGKAVYIILMGLGCNTMSSLISRDMNEKNLKIKTAILNPFVSCSARLPVFIIIASAFFGQLSFLVVSGLYLLGLVVLLITAYILNKTILPTKSNDMMLEFPPLRFIDFKHLLIEGLKSIRDFLKRITGIIISMGIIIFILSHTKFSLMYTDNVMDSILYLISSKLTFLFVPIGLNNAGIVASLIVGILAKELIVSTFSVCNNAIGEKELIASLTLSTSLICLNKASAISFLIFSLLYCPCISTLGVIKKETSSFYMWLTIIGGFVVAYLISMFIYLTLTKGIFVSLIVGFIISLIFVSLIYLIKKVKHNKCLTCNKCKF